MTYLIKVTEQYRCDTEEETKLLIDEAKKSNQYTAVKSSSEIKNIKLKGEIVGTYRRVLITKVFTEEKEPDIQLKPEYVEDY